MAKKKKKKTIDESLEQLEKELELNNENENEQSDAADEMIELIDIQDEDYDEFADVEFIDQDEKRRRKIKIIKGQIFKSIIMLIALFIFGYASYELALVYLENDTSFEVKDEITNMFLQDVEDLPNGNVIYTSEGETIIMENASDGKAFVWDYQKMLEYNSESVGYIRQGKGEYIDYPILQHSDNDYYLYHLPDHKWSSMGSIFLDYRIEGGLNADYSIVYGHYIGKRANNIMFGSLNWYWDRGSYHKEHPDFDIYVEDRHYKYYVFSIMKVPAAGDRVYNPYFESDEARLEFFEDVKSQSKYTFKEAPELTLDSKVIMLSTCTTDKEVRFVMFLVRGEEIYDVPGVDYENDASTEASTSKDETTKPPVESTDESSSEQNSSSTEETTTKKPVVDDTSDSTTKPQESTTKEQNSSSEQATTTKQPETTKKQEETTPPETTPSETEPEETEPDETEPDETTPVETPDEGEPSASEDSSDGSGEEETTPM